MSILLIFMLLVAVKLPLLAVGYLIYKLVNDPPEPEVDGRGGDFVRAEFEPGPRRRGPHGDGPAIALAPRRGDKGHDEAPARTLDGSGRTTA